MTSVQLPLIESYWPAEETGEVRDISLGQLLREATASVPGRPALVDGVADPELRRTWSYAELLEEAERAARALLRDFAPGDRISIWAPNSAAWVILQQGISLAGMVMVAINPSCRSGEVQYILNQSEAAGIFHADSYRGYDMAGALDELQFQCPALRKRFSFDSWDAFMESGDDNLDLPDVGSTNPIQIQYTSGTTGFPKGALLHHKGVINEAHFVSLRAGVPDGGVCINAMPMYHIGGGAVTLIGTMAMHGTFVIMPGFDPGLMLELFESHQGTHALVVPTMLIALLDHPDRSKRDLSSLLTIMSGASAVPRALVTRTIDLLGCQFSILFGQTEMHGVISQTRVSDAPIDQAETVGRPLPQLEVKIADTGDGSPVPIGEQGEVCCRGYQNMLGYYNMPEMTAAAVDSDGWLHMGDLGSMDERGFLKITGRLKDMIIRGGMNIYPREIEELLFTHPSVGDVAVIGVPDDEWGEQVAAVIQLKRDAEEPTADELKQFCRERLAAFKTPTWWIFVDELPVTPTGKVQKFVLRDQFATKELDAGQVDGVTRIARSSTTRRGN